MIDDFATFEYYQEVHLWPLNQSLNYIAWLDNFKTKPEREIAIKILESFFYFSDDLINQMLSTVIGKCGFFFKNKVPGWSHGDFYNNCWYSSMPSETRSFADSGSLFARKLREVADIPEQRIVNFDALIDLICKDQEVKNIILVDDFVGTGIQCDHAWNNPAVGKPEGRILGQLANAKSLNIVYAPLIVNDIGRRHILKTCHGLELVYLHLLTEEYSLFNPNGLCWQGKTSLFNRWMQLFNKICKQQNIPLTDGKEACDAKGYYEQGLSIAFQHGIPDACPAFFYWSSDTWNPLIKKHYQYGQRR